MDPEDLRSLPTSEAALRLPRSLAASNGAISSNNTFCWAQQAYERNAEADVLLLERLSDAWAWLVTLCQA